MKELITCIFSNEDGPSSIAELAAMPASVRDDMFDLGVKGLCDAGSIPAHAGPRAGQLSYTTLYNYLRQHM